MGGLCGPGCLGSSKWKCCTEENPRLCQSCPWLSQQQDWVPLPCPLWQDPGCGAMRCQASW